MAENTESGGGSFDQYNTTCQRCRSRKQKCDGRMPTCDRCAQIGAFCLFPLKKKPGRKHVIDKSWEEENSAGAGGSENVVGGGSNSILKMTTSLERLACKLKHNTKMATLLDAANTNLVWMVPNTKFRTYAAADFWEAAMNINTTGMRLKDCSPSEIETLYTLLFHLLLFSMGALSSGDVEHSDLFGQKVLDLVDCLLVKGSYLPSAELLCDVKKGLVMVYLLSQEDLGKVMRVHMDRFAQAIDRINSLPPPQCVTGLTQPPEPEESLMGIFNGLRQVRDHPFSFEVWEQRYKDLMYLIAPMTDPNYLLSTVDPRLVCSATMAVFVLWGALSNDDFRGTSDNFLPPPQRNLSEWQMLAYRLLVSVMSIILPDTSNHVMMFARQQKETMYILHGALIMKTYFLITVGDDTTLARRAASIMCDYLSGQFSTFFTSGIKPMAFTFLYNLAVLMPEKYWFVRTEYVDRPMPIYAQFVARMDELADNQYSHKRRREMDSSEGTVSDSTLRTVVPRQDPYKEVDMLRRVRGAPPMVDMGPENGPGADNYWLSGPIAMPPMMVRANEPSDTSLDSDQLPIHVDQAVNLDPALFNFVTNGRNV